MASFRATIGEISVGAVRLSRNGSGRAKEFLPRNGVVAEPHRRRYDLEISTEPSLPEDYRAVSDTTGSHRGALRDASSRACSLLFAQ
jgi:hypothetical protein